MRLQPQPPFEAQSWLSGAVAEACRYIAPNWPLARQIAVNPWWGLVHRPFHEVSQELQQLLGMQMSWSLREYQQAWRTGALTQVALQRALTELQSHWSLHALIDVLTNSSASQHDGVSQHSGLPLLSDCLDQHGVARGDALWREVITQQISQFCASYFDDTQADWQRGQNCDHDRDQHRGLYLTWRDAFINDPLVTAHSQQQRLQQRWQQLPVTTEDALQWAVAQLRLAPASASKVLALALLRINGWAAWCAYLEWQAKLSGTPLTTSPLQELLVIRLTWEALLLAAPHSFAAWTHWQQCWQQRSVSPTTELGLLAVLQRAHEITYQDALVRQFNERHRLRSATATEVDADNVTATTTTTTATANLPSTRLVFCIDVRSERLRRALEAIDPQLSTHGFAGFFGLPIAYTPLATQYVRPQLPGLVAPAFTVSDSTGDVQRDQQLATLRYHALTRLHEQQPLQRSAVGNFALVESMGLFYAWSLLCRHLGWQRGVSAVDQVGLQQHAQQLRPQWPAWTEDQVAVLADMLVGIVRAMGLTKDLPQLLVLVGHGSASSNNPQAAALECGACGGHAGDINARVLASLLNNPTLRHALQQRDVHLPETTWVLAALHNTTTDEVQWLDSELVPSSHHALLAQLQQTLDAAADQVRAERAPSLQLSALISKPKQLRNALQRRATDWAQTRPEWGLANNAAFIIAPRARSRGLNLDGRSFLHDYHWADDPSGKLLEQIMTAPMVVAHWINMQYFASTVEPVRFGSGNKVLHNVVGSGLGIFEGNSGDLRIGLSRQSVHDGQQWLHSPLRLSVCIDAPRAVIDTVLAQQAVVRDLVVNQWLYLFRCSDCGMEYYQQGAWHLWDKSIAPVHGASQ